VLIPITLACMSCMSTVSLRYASRCRLLMFMLLSPRFLICMLQYPVSFAFSCPSSIGMACVTCWLSVAMRKLCCTSTNCFPL